MYILCLAQLVVQCQADQHCLSCVLICLLIDLYVWCSEDFLRQTEYGYGEENLGGDDLSDLRAAADGHGPFAKYK